MILSRSFPAGLLFVLGVSFGSHSIAQLSLLEVTFTPDSNHFEDGESVLVSAATNDGSDPEFRFVLQHHDTLESGFVPVSDTDWRDSHEYQLDVDLADGESGNYRLITLARKKGDTNDLIGSSRAFLFDTDKAAICEYLEGKTFVPEGESEQETVSYSGGDAWVAVDLPLGTEARKFETISFSGDEVSLELAYPLDTHFGLYAPPDDPEPGEGEQVHVDPLEGTYGCEDGAVSIIEASGQGLSSSSSMEFMVSTSGTLGVDPASGQLVVDGVIFALEDETGSGLGSGGDGSDGLAWGYGGGLLILFLGLIRRRVRQDAGS